MIGKLTFDTSTRRFVIESSDGAKVTGRLNFSSAADGIIADIQRSAPETDAATIEIALGRDESDDVRAAVTRMLEDDVCEIIERTFETYIGRGFVDKA